VFDTSAVIGVTCNLVGLCFISVIFFLILFHFYFLFYFILFYFIYFVFFFFQTGFLPIALAVLELTLPTMAMVALNSEILPSLPP